LFSKSYSKDLTEYLTKAFNWFRFIFLEEYMEAINTTTVTRTTVQQ